MNTKMKGWITTFFLVIAISTTTITANAGTIIGGRSANGNSCTEPTVAQTSDDLAGTIIGGLTGTIIGGLAGTIIGGLTGTIIGGASSETINCGTIIGG